MKAGRENEDGEELQCNRDHHGDEERGGRVRRLQLSDAIFEPLNRQVDRNPRTRLLHRFPEPILEDEDNRS